MDTDSFIVHIETEDFFKDIANDVEKKYDKSNYKAKRPLPTGKNKKVLRLMKDELGGKIMIESVAPRLKIYSYLTDDEIVHKNDEGTNKQTKKENL